jgi:hypothetical protein
MTAQFADRQAPGQRGGLRVGTVRLTPFAAVAVRLVKCPEKHLVEGTSKTWCGKG